MCCTMPLRHQWHNENVGTESIQGFGFEFLHFRLSGSKKNFRKNRKCKFEPEQRKEDATGFLLGDLSAQPIPLFRAQQILFIFATTKFLSIFATTKFLQFFGILYLFRVKNIQVLFLHNGNR